MVLIVICLIPAILLAAEILIKNRIAKILLRILDTMVALVYIAVCMLFAALSGTMIGGETKYMDPLSITAVIGVLLLGILFLGFVWKWYRKKGFRIFIGAALLLCFLIGGGIVATWQYHSHIAVVSVTDDLSKYNLKREDNLLVKPDWEPTLKLEGNYPVMDGATALYPVYAAFMEGIITKVADYKNYKNAIGFSFRFYASEMVQNDQIKLLSIDGVAPTRENIINGTYPLSGEFYAVTRSDASEETRQLIDWIHTDQGQEIIEKTGYVSLRE